ncbi:peptidylprolyl isomerase [Paenibacillus sp. LHD-117]|uniref:peptidylprolyl isomerase n=1 Tax=Paenibacillus sp. LHD-117 TaxID=3071412 RepID=UPI0027DF8C75|nr:peptidylprolyl isomerase [Paenibacillus sp. LHD-117]MDQ6419553.1 peptidylprolyl isomerase [Paenibacillus sp. LHD-117]
MKRTMMVSIIVLLISAIICVLTIVAIKRMSGDTGNGYGNSVAFVNGIPVAAEELELYGLEELVKVKAAQQEAIQYGLLKDGSYHAFLKEWREENERRARALENKEPIYGPKQYTEKMYYDYRQSILLNAIQSIWTERRGSATEEEIYAYYMDNRDRLARKHDFMTLLKIVEPIEASLPNSGSDRRREAEQKIEDIKLQLDNGTAFMDLYDKRRLTEGLTGTETIREDNYRNISKYRSGYYELVANLRQGENSAIIESVDSYEIVLCVLRTPEGYLPFDDVREEVIRQYRDKGFEAYMDKLASKAEINLTPLYETLTAEK